MTNDSVSAVKYLYLFAKYYRVWTDMILENNHHPVHPMPYRYYSFYGIIPIILALISKTILLLLLFLNFFAPITSYQNNACTSRFHHSVYITTSDVLTRPLWFSKKRYSSLILVRYQEKNIFVFVYIHIQSLLLHRR